jgi:hypothetical protein
MKPQKGYPMVYNAIQSPVTATLIDARKLLSNGWTKYTHAVNQEGESVPVDAEDACSFCITGAIKRSSLASVAFGYDAGVAARTAVRSVLYQNLGNPSIVEFNDSELTTKNGVLNVISAAIALSKKETT